MTLTRAAFFAAARISDTPPMSMFSIASSNRRSGFATVVSNGYRFTTTRSIGTRKQAGLPHEIGHDFFPPDRHDVDPADALDFLQCLDRPHRDAHALRLRIRGAVHSVQDVLRDDRSQLLDHEPGHLRGL